MSEKVRGLALQFLERDAECRSYSEGFEFVEAKFEGQLKGLADIKSIEGVLSGLVRSEEITISTKVDGNSEIWNNHGSRTLSNFVEELNSCSQLEDERESVVLTITIVKSPEKTREIAVFRVAELCKKMSEMKTIDLLISLTKYLREGSISFILHEIDGINLCSETICLSSTGVPSRTHSGTRANQITAAAPVCHFENSALVSLLPSDFEFRGAVVPKEVEPLIRELSKLREAVLLCRLLDISRIDNSTISYRLGGYKAHIGNHLLQSKDFDESIEWYSGVHDWVYESASISDRISIARNYIGLHLKDGNGLALASDPLPGIRSGWQMFQKQNIKQYLEVRGKALEQLTEISNKAIKISETFISSFQKSTFSFLSFFASALLIKLLGKGDSGPLIGTGAAVITMVFVAGSILHLLLSWWEVDREQTRLEDSYKAMKRRFLDLLDPTDIDRVLGNDTEFEESDRHIRTKVKCYRAFWIVLIIFVTIATWACWCFNF